MLGLENPSLRHFRTLFAGAILGLLLPGSTALAGAKGADDSRQSPTVISELGLEALLETEVVPISVLGTHTHLEGEWMLGYQFMSMGMNGNRDGTRDLSDGDVLNDFLVAPTKMTMQMHMPMLMYAPSDDLTLMAMIPYIQLEMDHITRTGVRFTTRSEGFGDLNLGARYTVFRHKFDDHRVILSGRVSFPTGSIDEKDFLANPSQGKQKLPYPMQLGSGTVDLQPGISYLGHSEDWTWGAEVEATIRLGENSNDYTLGNRYRASVWGDWRWTDWVAPFIRIDGLAWGNIDGADPDLNPLMVPTADPNRRGGERVDLLFGVNFYVPEGLLKGHRLAVQGGLPIYQSLDGPQLETDWQFTIGWQWVF